MLVKALTVPFLWLPFLVWATASTLKDHDGNDVKVVNVKDLPSLLAPQTKAIRRAVQPVTAIVNLINKFQLFEFCASYIHQPAYPHTTTIFVQTTTVVETSATTETKPTVTVTTFAHTAPMAKRTSGPESKRDDSEDDQGEMDLPTAIHGHSPSIVSSACSLALATRTATIRATTTTTTTVLTTTTTTPIATVTACAAQRPVDGGGIGGDSGQLNYFTDANSDQCCTRCWSTAGCGLWFFFPGFGCFNANNANGPDTSTQCPAGHGRYVMFPGSQGSQNVGGAGPCSGGFF